MTEDKTTEEWLKTLPPTLRDLALKNARHENLSSRRPSLARAINHAFMWNNTPEDHNFWDSIYRYAHKLPDLKKFQRAVLAREKFNNPAHIKLIQNLSIGSANIVIPEML